MRHHLLILLFLSMAFGASAQLKPRSDAFPPVPEPSESKAINMATTVAEMDGWDHYPTYPVYLEMMHLWATNYPGLCHVDTIGISVQGRLILSMYIETPTDADLYRPEFFYSSTIHGDEVTGYVMMLHLIDTLLASYGTHPELTSLMDRTRISINPLANPDGTYWHGDNTLHGAQRYNANNVDLNRSYPDPFNPSKTSFPQENQAMIDYLTAHHFRLSANLHGGAEVINYPWDSFTSANTSHPAADWWQEVSKRFVDTARTYSYNHFNDVTTNGYTAGGDWYIITGGRQDYVNYVHNCLEMTMEISTQKTLSSDRLPEYWHFLAPALIHYIGEIHSLPDNIGIEKNENSKLKIDISPNPCTDRVTVTGLPEGSLLELYDAYGRLQLATHHPSFIISGLPAGIYLLRTPLGTTKIVKR